MKRMKTIGLLLTMATLVVFMSCGGDDDGIKIDPNLEIDFDAATASVGEDGSAITLTLSFPEAPSDVSVTAAVTGTAVYGTDYTTSPAVTGGNVTLSVSEGDTEATITFTPIDNQDVDGSKTVIFTLQAAEGLELGTNTSMTVTITDNEVPKTTKTIADLRALYDGSVYPG